MNPTPESLSEATQDSRDEVKGNLGRIEEKAGELYVGVKDKEEARSMSTTDKAASAKEGAGETFEPATEGSKNRAHGGDESSKGDAGKPNQGEGPDDSQGSEGVDIPKESVSERKNVEKTRSDSEVS